MSEKGTDVIVIGGGIHGCSAALHLAQRGLSVTVVEKDYVGRHASGVNAGGIRRLGRAFPEIPLSVASAKIWSEIENLVDNDCMFRPSNQIKVAENEDELRQLTERSQKVREMGFDHEEIIDQATLRELLPEVSPHCIGGAITKGDGHANPFQTVMAFKRKCQLLGVQFMEGVRVNDIEHHNNLWKVSTLQITIESPVLINCAGAWGGKIAALLGEPVPLEASAPMLMITARMPHFINPVVGAQGRPLSFKQFDNGTVLIGGGHQGVANTENNQTQLDLKGLAVSAQTAASVFPLMQKAKVVRCWAGIEGMMPDRIPVIGPSNREGAFHAFGFSAHGFQLGPVGGKILSDLVLDGITELPITPFDINRFN